MVYSYQEFEHCGILKKRKKKKPENIFPFVFGQM